ncbi:hypothetical protein R3P38DRAFT_1633892 [Favolaschia claudopus]|uniref:Secreted protein n=1 Tax=Favolaschia claudopus TaxID=2862362 RepID=A0AAW0DJH1_9AGAR
MSPTSILCTFWSLFSGLSADDWCATELLSSYLTAYLWLLKPGGLVSDSHCAKLSARCTCSNGRSTSMIVLYTRTSSSSSMQQTEGITGSVTEKKTFKPTLGVSHSFKDFRCRN